MKKTMSTTQVASLLGVSSQTIANWIDQGQLPAGRTPGGHRRVEAQDLLAFLAARGLPIPEELVDREHTLLVVEDDPQLGPWIVAQLVAARPDLRVLLAQDGFMAGELVAVERPATILLDIYLRGLDGFEVCRRIKSRPETSATNVIAVTAHATPEVCETITEAGALECLPKPVDLAALLGLLAKCMPVKA
jgi:excisionase family DNA binding protein